MDVSMMIAIPIIPSTLSTQSHTNSFDTASEPEMSSLRGRCFRSVDSNSHFGSRQIADDHLIGRANP